jgi:Sugar (and other) transporter
MFAKMGYGVYFFFSYLMILSIAFVYFLIPETKGIPLESMDLLFEQKSMTNAHKIVLGRIREDEERFRHEIEASGIAAEKERDVEGQHVEVEDTSVGN